MSKRTFQEVISEFRSIEAKQQELEEKKKSGENIDKIVAKKLLDELEDINTELCSMIENKKILEYSTKIMFVKTHILWLLS